MCSAVNFKLRCYISLFALIFIAVEVQAIIIHSESNDECLTLSHANIFELEEFFWNMKPNGSVELKCHFKCLMDKRDLWSNGAFLIPDNLNLDTKLQYIADYCGKKNGTDDCDTAFQITKCLRAIPPGLKILNLID